MKKKIITLIFCSVLFAGVPATKVSAISDKTKAWGATFFGMALMAVGGYGEVSSSKKQQNIVAFWSVIRALQDSNFNGGYADLSDRLKQLIDLRLTEDRFNNFVTKFNDNNTNILVREMKNEPIRSLPIFLGRLASLGFFGLGGITTGYGLKKLYEIYFSKKKKGDEGNNEDLEALMLETQGDDQ